VCVRIMKEKRREGGNGEEDKGLKVEDKTGTNL
jgi:hypothetical protein